MPTKIKLIIFLKMTGGRGAYKIRDNDRQEKNKKKSTGRGKNPYYYHWGKKDKRLVTVTIKTLR